MSSAGKSDAAKIEEKIHPSRRGKFGAEASGGAVGLEEAF